MFAEAAGFGLVTAAVVALAAVGLSLQVGVTNFINFAYGDFMTFGAYVAYAVNAAKLPFAVAVLAGGIATGLLGVLANRAVFQPFVRRGARTITLLTLLHVGLRYTKFGKALRATSNNADLARASGIDTERVVAWTWMISGFLAAVAGVGLALELNGLQPVNGFNELFVVFGAIILGGIGRPYGAMIGALILGELTEISGMYFNAAYKTSVAFAVVVILLLVRPQGILAASGKST